MGRMRVLIVEDELIVAMDIKNTLTRLGHTVTDSVSSSADALAAVAQSRPDLVLMDILLRDSPDGIETARLIRERYDIPVVYLTAYADQTTLERAKLTEPYGYILKPFQERDLHTSIEIAVFKHTTDNKLREKEERYRRYFEEDLTGYFRASGEGVLLECNPAFMRIFGLHRGEAPGFRLPLLFPDTGQWERFVADLTEKEKMIYHERGLVRLDGSSVYVIGNIIGVFDTQGRLAELHGYLFDDTRRKRLEQQLLQVQKMEAVGRLAGGIAHDFNNLLTVITGYSEHILSVYGKGEPMMEQIREIKQAGERASMLTRQLLAFRRAQVLKPKLTDLNSIVINMERMLQRLIGENIILHTKLSGKLWRVEVDPGQMEQVIMNLAVNSRDAMPGGGTLTIETDNAVVGEPIPEIHPPIKTGSYVVLSVSDSGHGMDAEPKLHLFAPFFTTKTKGEGTGLGLSTVYGIVAQSGGHIGVHSELGKGARFTIFLPRALKAGAHASEEKEGSEKKIGTEVVLVVEDEDAVRNLIIRILGDYGYTVLGARSGEEALSLIEHHQGGVELVVADIVLPGMSGPQLVERLMRERPGIRRLFISGYTDRAIQDIVAAEGEMHFLRKPFKPAELSAKVRDVLDRGE